MTDGAYIYAYRNGQKDITVWTRDGEDLHIVITNVDTWSSENIYLPAESLAKAILREAWRDD